MNNISDSKEILHNCSGCQICAAVCSYNAITIALDEEGFYKPQIQANKCKQCGYCLKSCYKYDKNLQMILEEKNIRAYAAYTKDNELLLKSTSGGVSSQLLKACLDKGYKAVGVSYDYDNNIAISEIIDDYQLSDKFRGSKYMPAYTEKAFRQIINSNEKYAVFGTACQIYALNKWAVNVGRRDQFIFIDLFCHGYPSLNLWKKYSEYIKEKLRVSKFDKIEFRSKKYGWHEYCTSFYKGNVVFSSEKNMDPFFTLFFDNQLLGQSCYDCLLRSTLNYTDIRLGDFWGDDYDTNSQGVSALVVCTRQGQKLLEQIKHLLVLKEKTLKCVIKAQPYGKEYKYNPEIRNKLIRLLSSQTDMHAIFIEYLNAYPIKKKIYLISKNMIYLLPKPLRYRIKKFIICIGRLGRRLEV